MQYTLAVITEVLIVGIDDGVININSYGVKFLED